MAAERSLVSSAIVPAPPDLVWEIVSDTSRYAEWVEATTEVTRSDGPAARGSTYDERNKVVGPFNWSSRWTVEEVEAPRRQVHRGEGIPLVKSMTVVMELAPAGESTEYTHTLHYVPAFGPLGQLLDRALRGSLQRDHEKSVANLAELAGREAAAAREPARG